MIDVDAARRLGVNRAADERLIAQAVLRQSGLTVTDGDIPRGIAKWIAGIGVALAEQTQGSGFRGVSCKAIAQRVATEQIRTLSRFEACGALAFIAPDQTVPAAQARDIGKSCRALLVRELPWFCQRVLHDWVLLGHIVDRDVVDPADVYDTE